MRRSLSIFGLLLASFTVNLLGQQHAVDPANRYYRVIALVHLTGSGKPDDPIRPQFVPGPAEAIAQASAAVAGGTNENPVTTAAAPARAGIIAWSFQLTDDKQMAIVHIVALDHHSLDQVLSAASPDAPAFEIGKQQLAAIETSLQKYKKGFTLGSLSVVAR
jgi:hypothetical protein